MQFRQISNSSSSCLNLLGLGSKHVLGNSYFDDHACLHICVWCTYVSVCILAPCVPLYLFLPPCIHTGDMRTLRKHLIFPVRPRKDPTTTHSLSSPSSRLSCSAVDFVSSSSCLTSLSLCSSFCCTASNSSRASFNSSLMTFFSEVISSWNEQSCCWRLADNSCFQTDKHKIIRCGLRTFLGDKKCNTDNEVWQIN